MLREDCRVGMVVEFGRENGELTKGEVVKMNPTKAKVKTLEQRGNGRGSRVGAEWGVPYSMMRPFGQSVQTAVPNVAEQPISYNRFQDHAEQCILEAIVATYSKLNARLQSLFKAYGRPVSESVAYKWMEDCNTNKKAV